MVIGQLIDITATVVHWIDDHQPGFVLCTSLDRFGIEHRFIDKLPVVIGVDGIWGQDMLPAPGYVRGKVVGLGIDDFGRSFAVVDTGEPWDIRATDDRTIFEVLESGLTHHP